MSTAVTATAMTTFGSEAASLGMFATNAGPNALPGSHQNNHVLGCVEHTGKQRRNNTGRQVAAVSAAGRAARMAIAPQIYAIRKKRRKVIHASGTYSGVIRSKNMEPNPDANPPRQPPSRMPAIRMKAFASLIMVVPVGVGMRMDRNIVTHKNNCGHNCNGNHVVNRDFLFFVHF